MQAKRREDTTETLSVIETFVSGVSGAIQKMLLILSLFGLFYCTIGIFIELVSYHFRGVILYFVAGAAFLYLNKSL